MASDIRSRRPGAGPGDSAPAWRKAGSGRSDAGPGTLDEAVALQALEGNPLTAEEVAMFEMFEREGWPHERRRAHIISSLQGKGARRAG